MEKPKPDILQVKAPTKWDILKFKSKHIKEYLKGRFVEKGGFYNPMPIIPTSKFDNPEFTKKHRIRRKKLNKISYKSRRKNRSGL
jgi:hypothetical protein